MLVMRQNSPVKIKPVFKEKFIVITESLFKRATPYDEATDSATFWDAYLILDVNSDYLTQLIHSMSEESLLNVRHNSNLLFSACVERLNCRDESNASERTRQIHSLQLLSTLLKSLFAKKRLSYFNIINLLTGLDKADVQLNALVKTLDSLIKQPTTRAHALVLALVLSAGNNNVNNNSLNSYFMNHDLSRTLFEVIADQDMTETQTRHAVMLLGMLSNYNKYESRNPYLTALSRINDANVLKRLVSLFKNLFSTLISRFCLVVRDDNTTLTKSVVTYMTSWFSTTSSPDLTDIEALNEEIGSMISPPLSALLLPFYDLMNTNSHFMMVYTSYSTSKDTKENDETPIAVLLSFVSYLVQYNRSEHSAAYTKLMFLVLLRLTEDDTFLSFMARDDTHAIVRLCRQRQPPLPRMKKPRSLLCVILDDALLYTKHNLRKKLDLPTYRLAFLVIHRILCFLSKRQIRLAYHWSELWSSLTAILHFIVMQWDDLILLERFDTFLYSFVSIFNISVAQGETFLPDTKAYDALFYELIRASDDMMALSQGVSRTMMNKTREDRSPVLSFTDFSNLRMICNHFKPALDEWQTTHNVKYPSPEQVIGIIHDNYGTLELAPMGKLDSVGGYKEAPAEMGFLRHMLRIAVEDYCGHLSPSESRSMYHPVS
ncbi:uncharacterized protein BYT42DRAFT_131682 [Radiomyces spectabilis]|uniref:uncharacterized protein n=1 Tax=Radiomyces spectabilis TaxID=64574 RepID=UPI002221055F|nr:uncharacterized protein BYT42DRAFT_131682 [Radiomyces spectabilis]KAI8367579.1 hypothetical protein BYT42DRAFT_131682 [Radiomyces spectabilis]